MKVHHECPQCGAPVVLDESARLFSCAFCRVKLYIQSKDFLKYCFVPPDNAPDNIFFIPYWHFRGIHFVCKTNKLEHGILDKTVLAVDRSLFPFSLGLRSQTLKVRLVKPSDRWPFIQPQSSFRESFVSTEQKVSFKQVAVRNELTLFDSFSVPVTEMVIKKEEVFWETFLSDTLSLLYTPAFIRDSLIYDAILNEPVTGIGDKSLDLDEADKNAGISFMPVLCPNCGWEMESGRDSTILICTHCETLWQAEMGGFKNVSFAVIAGTKTKGNSRPFYLPFWRMEISIRGIDLGSYADLVRFANLPKNIQPGWEEAKLYFWAPAFKVPPTTFLTLARQFTLSQPDTALNGSIRGTRSYHINLPLREAVESVRITLAGIAARKNITFPALGQIHVECIDSLLVFCPFTETKTEFIQNDLRLGIQKNALELGQEI